MPVLYLRRVKCSTPVVLQVHPIGGCNISTRGARTGQSSSTTKGSSSLVFLPVHDVFAAHSREGRTFTRGTSTFARARADTTKISSTATVVRHRPVAATPRRALRNARGCGCRTPRHPTVVRAGSKREARASWRRRVAHPTVTGDRGVGQPMAHPWSAGAEGGCRGGDQRDEIVPPGRQDARAPPHGGATAVGRGPVRQPVGGAQRGGPDYVGAAIHGQVCSARREGPDT